MVNSIRPLQIPLVLQRVKTLHTKYAGQDAAPVFSQCGYCKSFKFKDAPEKSKWYPSTTFTRLMAEVKRELKIEPLISHGGCQPCLVKAYGDLAE